MAAGVATVIGHNIWSGGALPVAVTALGWMMLVKGVVLMASPPEMLVGYYSFLNSGRRLRLVTLPLTLLSAWMTVAAFSA